MSLDELYAKRKELLAQVAEADEALFAELQKKIAKIDYQIEETEKQEDNERKKAEKNAEMRAARSPFASANKTLVDTDVAKAEETRKANAEKVETRANTLKNGGKVTISARSVTSSTTAMSTIASDTINPAFEQVGSLDKLVNNTELNGGESYKKPFVKTYGEGGVTEEGKPATTADPDFGYAPINKVKITAYAEVTEEVEKLPSAKYMAEVEKAVVGAYKKKLIAQIINGSGDSELVGIVNTPTTIINANQTHTIATIDENTLDNFIFEYGGDEDVEDDAVIILNKLSLKEFAKVKGADKRRAYDIIVKGNSGTINGIPFVCSSKVAPFATVTAGKPYILYGKLAGYELTHFSDLDLEKSKDYKFKEGMIAYKVSGMVGGSCAMWNGFLSVVKAAAPTQPAQQG